MSAKSILVTAALPAALSLSAQCDRWQQRIRCEMDVQLDVSTHRFSGEQELRYTNNSPDTLRELYFHL
ncbi:MAG: M1 family peptidase, partial [Flavobacteriales bacterium]|nr:M1 family peptidase [Flavobacteriales bacterium]